MSKSVRGVSHPCYITIVPNPNHECSGDDLGHQIIKAA